MSWRNTDRAYGSRARGLRGLDGLDGLGRAGAWTSSATEHPHGAGIHGLEGFVPPNSIPALRWRNTDRAYGNRPKGLPFSGVGLGDAGSDAIGTDIGTMIGTDIAANPPLVLGYPPDQASGSANWPNAVTSIAQQGFNDAFRVLQLLNPVPPGTVMQTGPGGTFVSRAPSGSAATPSLSLASGSNSVWLLLLVGVGAVVLLSKGR